MSYMHKEYPKLLHFPGKSSVRVLSAEEEAVAHAEHGHAPKPPKPEKSPKAAKAEKSAEHSGVDRKALIAKAKAAGVTKANFRTTEELIALVG